MKKLLSLVLVVALLSVSALALAETHGTAVITSIAKSKAATAEADGTAQVDSTFCAVALDDAGKIVALSFEAAQTKVGFNAKGELTADLTAEIKSKKELGADYGMKKASAIGKEYDEQIAALEAWCIGKTVEEAVTKMGAGDDADLLAGCTMSVDGYSAALTKAAANAK